LLAAGESLLAAESDEVDASRVEWQTAFDALRVVTGESM
jgi:hypothetical protein